MPFYLLPLIPIILAPIFILQSDLKLNQKVFYSLYPLVLFILVHILFHHRTRIPRRITFSEKGWFSIIYNVQNQKRLESENGFRLINFESEPILLTSSKQTEAIPVSESEYFYKGDNSTSTKKIYFNVDKQYILNDKDSLLYIYFENFIADSTYCFNLDEKNSTETFYIGTINEYFSRDSIYPINLRNKNSNSFFNNYCKIEKNKNVNQ